MTIAETDDWREAMARDAQRMRKDRPSVMANMKIGEGVEAATAFIREKGGLAAERARRRAASARAAALVQPRRAEL
jgi:hypothetical protein